MKARTLHPGAPRALVWPGDLLPRAVRRGPDMRAGPGVSFLESVRAFRDFGTVTQEGEDDGIPYLVNEFWTSGQRQAHSLHEISYRACFKAQLPEFFISRLTRQGDSVYDPFAGRGTTPVQAALMGRRALANDVNPLSILLTRPRFRPPALEDIRRALSRIDWDARVQVREDLAAFYHPETLRQLCVLREWLLTNAPLDLADPDPVPDWIRMVALNRLTGHSPGFFSVYTLPPNQAVSIEAQRKINARRRQVPPPRDVASLIVRKSRSLLDDRPHRSTLPHLLTTSDARHASGIADASADLVVTSPPFLDIVHYAADNWLRCWFAGIDADSVRIDMHRTEASWSAMVREVLADLARIVRPGGHVAFEVGEVRRGRLLLERLVWAAAEGLKFDRLAVMVNQQAFTKTANCWGVRNNSGGTNTNRIVILRRR